MSHQKIQSRLHALHRKLWLGVARFQSQHPGYGVWGKSVAYEKLLPQLRQDELDGRECFACLEASKRSQADQDSRRPLCYYCPLQWTTSQDCKPHDPKCLSAASEFKAEPTFENARKIAYMKWHEDSTSRKY